MPKLHKEDYPHNARITEKICPECNIVFYAHNTKAIYCSPLCRNNAFMKRKQKKEEFLINSLTADPISEAEVKTDKQKRKSKEPKPEIPDKFTFSNTKDLIDYIKIKFGYSFLEHVIEKDLTDLFGPRTWTNVVIYKKQNLKLQATKNASGSINLKYL